MAPTDKEVIIMFADIVGSTRLYETLGDENAEKLVTTTLRQLSDIASKSHGETIKTGGDDVMCRFSQADDAITAAREMHEFLARKTIATKDYKLAIRVGAHQGPVIESDGDLYGDAVNLAARVAALARGGKTMITEYTYKNLPASTKKRCQYFTRTVVKGKELPIEVFDVVWEQTEELTRLAGSHSPKVVRNILILQYGERVIKLCEDKITSVTLGRSEDCDLVIPSPHASREHCLIEYNRGKFILRDNSANGSYVTHNQAELLFHQEQIALLGEGSISLGAPCAVNPEFVVIYSIEAADNPAGDANR